MTVRTIAMLSAATLALAACGKPADTTTTTNTEVMAANETPAAEPMAVTGGQVFANAAAASDAFEIATSRAALDTSKSDAVRKFAQSMIDAHTKSTADLKTAAAGATPPITPDATLTPDQQATLDALKAKTGAEFDAAYVAGQTAGHQQTLDKLRDYSANGDVPTLKAFATTLVPTVAAHLNMAKGLKP